MGKYAKAIVAFLSLVATNEVAALASSHTLPVGVHGWVAAVATTVLGTLAVYLKSNTTPTPPAPKPTPKPAPVPVHK